MKNLKKMIFLSMIFLLVGCAQKEEGLVKDGFSMKELPYQIAFNGSILEGDLIQIEDPETEMHGFINTDGEVVIKEEHKMPIWFMDGLCYVESPNGSYYLNMQGEKVIEQVDGKPIVTGRSFDSSGHTVVMTLNKETMEEEYYVIDKEGKVIVKKELDGEDSKIWVDKEKNQYQMNYFLRPGEVFENRIITDPYVPITFYGNTQFYGIFDNEKKEFVTDLRYQNVSGFLKDRAIVEDKDGRFLIIDSKGNVTFDISEKYPGAQIRLFPLYAQRVGSERFAIYFPDKSKGAIILDLEGKEIMQTEYEEIGYFTNGYASTFRYGTDGNVLKFGLINANGEEILPQAYDKLGGVRDEKVVVKQDGKWYIADLSKKVG